MQGLTRTVHIHGLGNCIYGYLEYEERLLYRTLSKRWNRVFMQYIGISFNLTRSVAETKKAIEEKERKQTKKKCRRKPTEEEKKEKKRKERIASANALLADYHANICNWAAGRNYLDVLRYAHSHKYPLDPCIALEQAVRNGGLATFKWIVDAFPSKMAYDFSRHLLTAAETGKLDIIEWLHKNGHHLSRSMAEKAARGGHLPVLKYLHQYVKFLEAMVIIEAAENGHLDIIEWLAIIIPFGTNPIAWDSGMMAATGRHQIQILAFLKRKFGIFPSDIDKVLQRYRSCLIFYDLKFLTWMCTNDPFDRLRVILLSCVTTDVHINFECIEYLIVNHPCLSSIDIGGLIAKLRYDGIYNILKKHDKLQLLPDNAESIEREEKEEDGGDADQVEGDANQGGGDDDEGEGDEDNDEEEEEESGCDCGNCDEHGDGEYMGSSFETDGRTCRSYDLVWDSDERTIKRRRVRLYE
jgi:hypothetical protein